MNYLTYQETLAKLQKTQNEIADLIGYSHRTSRRYAASPSVDGSRKVQAGIGLLLQLMLDGRVLPEHILEARERIRRSDKRNTASLSTE